MKHIKTYESNKIKFIEGDIVKYRNDPYEITGSTDSVTFGKRWIHLKSLIIRDLEHNWIPDTEIRYLTYKEKKDLELILRANKYNL